MVCITSELLEVIFERWRVLLIFGAVVYLGVVSVLRFRRARSLATRFGFTDRASFSRMTVDDAQAILKELGELEFPKIMRLSIVFALFKTYGIPSVSSLLVATGQLATPETASKRTADTRVLLLEFALNKPSSDRTLTAIARMNYLHSRHRKSGKITDSDMLYTLSVFALEPARWIAKYEWRSMSDLELCASGTFWKAMGDVMMIPYDRLPSSKSGWRDGLHWLAEIRHWSSEYEEEFMLPARSNQQLADAHSELLFVNFPPALMEMGKKAISTFLDERLRKAVGFVSLPMRQI
ncbi:MAG: hypothetical protein M1837_007382 [Sclerophora amabilis]|nr:MAG: hypothetical protein M1837_007382 [Sclerophora amabilis]